MIRIVRGRHPAVRRCALLGPRAFPVAVLFALVVAAACRSADVTPAGSDSPSPSPDATATRTVKPPTTRTPRTATAEPAALSIAIGPAVPEALSDSIREWVRSGDSGLPVTVGDLEIAQDADLVVTVDDPGSAVRIEGVYWIALANVTSNVDDITSDFIYDAVAGAADWGDAEWGRAGPVTLYVAEEDASALAAVLGLGEEELLANAELASDDELLDLVLQDAAALTILPLDRVDTRGRSLAVDGVDLVRGLGSPADYPLVGSYFARVNEESSHAEAAAGLVRYLEEQAAPPDPIHILAVGDIIPARCVLANILSLGDVTAPFANVREKISSADIAFGTLDMQLTDAVQHQLCFENYVHTGPTELAEGMAWAGFDIIFNGTNHSMDGRVAGAPDAVQETRDAFEAVGIKTAGQGHNLQEALQPVVVEVKGVKFGFTAADGVASYSWAGETTPGTAPADPDTIGERVQELLARVDVVIATCECGIIDGDAEYRNLPTELQMAMAYNALDAGATQYIGGQSHWVQGAEFLGDMFIGYHMGNFVYDQDWSYETMHGAILDSYYIGPRLVNVRYSVVRIEGMLAPRILPPDEAQRTLDAIWGATPHVPGSLIAP